ncbi:MAG TPA: methyltransferase domain-containing protein [Allocoleopsis sp.]
MTPLKSMRLFHNSIKKLFLDKYIIKPKSSLLDLASGKGGDLQKWKQNKNITKVIGYDFNEESVKEAIRRKKEINIRKNIKFYVKNLAKEQVKCEHPFDAITIHFAFHYFFKNYNSLKNILTTIDSCSNTGTILMITMLDGDKLKNIKTDNYYIKLNKIGSKIYGNEVEVYIKGSVLDKPEIEYLVKPDTLVSKLSKVSFELIEILSFEELYLQQDTYILTKEEQNYSFLNNIYIFVKK